MKNKYKRHKTVAVEVLFFRFCICVFVFLFFIFNFSFAIEPSLGKLEKERIHNALQVLNVQEKELGFEKKWATDSIYRLKIVSDLLDNPLKTADYLDKSVQQIDNYQNKITPQLLYLSQQLDITITNSDVNKLKQEVINPNWIELTDIIISSYKVGDRYLKQAIKNLKQDELTKLLIEAPVLWSDEEDSLNNLKGALHREFGVSVDTSKKTELDTILDIVRRIDRRSLVLSGLAVAIGVDKVLNILKESSSSLPSPVKGEGTIKGNIYFYQETEWGKFVIGSEEDNTYEGNYALIIDIGGNDTYKGRTGGAIGILSNPFSVAIDLNGDDLYDAPTKLFNFGAGLFGAGFLIDLKGNDVYKGYHNSLGAGLLGIGVLVDNEGDDIYTGGYYTQGAGNFGIGILTDAKGNDTYHGYNYCQGFGSTWGYGLLTDFEGQDNYYAGGKYTHAPLLPKDYRSMAQGFSIGFRPTASGGIGFLYDKQGQDFYNASVFAQGTSYWYSLGMLYDGEGNDFYNATEYAQGAGIHLSVGILVDKQGDDHYFSRLGPAQGEGHDLSVGILIDKKGNDSYLTSGGQGIGLTNSFGLFIDSDGDDIYALSEKNFGQGMANWSRGFCGIGLFLDLQGNDKYPRESPADNSSQWTQSVLGAGIDIMGADKPIEDIVQEEPDTTITTIDEIFKMASLWEVGNARKKVRWARAKLNTRVIEVIEYIFKNKIDTKDGLELRAIEEIAKAHPDSIKPYLYKAIHNDNRYTRSNSIYIVGKIKAKDAIDTLLLALQDKRNRPRWIISAFEEIGDTSVVLKILPYLFSKDEPARIASVNALGKLKDNRAIPDLYKALNDEMFTVRLAVETALVILSDSSLYYILNEYHRGTETQRGRSDFPVAISRSNLKVVNSVIGILGSIAEKMASDSTSKLDKQKMRDEIKRIIIPYLDAKEPSFRLKAVEALGKKLNDPSLKPLLQSKMASETNEFVLTKYKQILKE